ncbi:MAG: HAMP domain-containing sensor histidine kinase [Acidiferrobacterales bacterium]|jgi:signal transduction histidine kinase
MSKKPLPEDALKDGGQMLLAQTIQNIARGDFSSLDDLYALPGVEGIDPNVAELAESIGLILVKLEARDFHLECAAEAEERLKELNKLKDTYLGIAAHDLRNPLSSIRGMSQMLVEMELDDGTKRSFLESIYRVSNQMLTLVNDLLDVSVIESGKFDLRLTEENLSKLAKERAELVAGSAEKKQIKLTTDLQEVSNSLFDPDRMRQVIDNLLTNAIKFSPAGTTVDLACRQTKQSLEISVADQGPGIPSEDIDKLFGTFQKLSVQPTAGEKSTGLGLSIVKQIVNAHGGEITVDSKVGKGSVFTVRIPVEPVS